MADREPNRTPSRAKNLSYAVLAGQAGCVTLLLIIVALFAGLWLDAHFGVKGPFTVGLLLLSIPISLFAMVRIALGMIREIQPPPPRGSGREMTSTTKEEKR